MTCVETLATLRAAVEIQLVTGSTDPGNITEALNQKDVLPEVMQPVYNSMVEAVLHDINPNRSDMI